MGVGGTGPAGGANTAGTSNGGAPPAGGSAGMAGSTTVGGAPPGGGTLENSGAQCASAAAELKKNNKLPDPFAMHAGTRISSKADWACRRNEIKKDVEKYEIGPKPEPPRWKPRTAATSWK